MREDTITFRSWRGYRPRGTLFPLQTIAPEVVMPVAKHLQNAHVHRASNRVVSYEVNIPKPKPWRETFVGGHCAQMYPAWLLCSS